ncbi:hypothetical protein [Nitrosopumilus sp.]|uniref:hypothetical protein n=1 Tax=Nitrosopumilus sp. TaxID=2024843 RepID=UPI00292E3D98|nr:hypothetical protein [Nitrosopumilus sp.]
MEEAVLFGVVVFGLIHGVSPSHGWTVAMLFSMQSQRPMLRSLISSGIIASAHFVSSIVVVVAYLLVVTLIEIPDVYLQYGAAIGLGILAYLFWREKGEDLIRTQHGHLHDHAKHTEHEHEHWHKETGYHSHVHIHQVRVLPSLKSIAAFAFVLGFVHEEEFVILALAAGGVEPLMLMIAYAGSVTAALIGITMLAVKAYTRFQYKFIHHNKYLPKITALILAVMAIGFATGIF